MLCNAPASRREAAADAPYAFLSRTPTRLVPRAGTVNVQISTLLHQAASATKTLREHDQCARRPGERSEPPDQRLRARHCRGTGSSRVLHRVLRRPGHRGMPTMLLRRPGATSPRERPLSSALMLGRPARGRRSQTSTRPTLLRSQPNTRHPRDRVRVRSECVGVEPCVRFTRTSSERRRTRTSEQHRKHSTTRSAMSEPGPDDRAPRPLVGGRLLAEITNRIVAFMREHYGRGPIKAKTYVLDNLIVCVLTDGFTAIERTMMEGGEPDRVLEMRRDFQRMMKERYSRNDRSAHRPQSARVPQPSTRRTRPHDRDLPDGRAASRIRCARARRPTTDQPQPPATTNWRPGTQTGRPPTEARGLRSSRRRAPLVPSSARRRAPSSSCRADRCRAAHWLAATLDCRTGRPQPRDRLTESRVAAVAPLTGIDLDGRRSASDAGDVSEDRFPSVRAGTALASSCAAPSAVESRTRTPDPTRLPATETEPPDLKSRRTMTIPDNTRQHGVRGRHDAGIESGHVGRRTTDAVIEGNGGRGGLPM